MNRRALAAFLVLAIAFSPRAGAAEPATPSFRVDAPRVVLDGLPFAVTVMALDAQGRVDATFVGSVPLSTGGVATFSPADRGVARQDGVVLSGSGRREIAAEAGSRRGVAQARVVPGVASIVAPVVAVVAAIVLRQVIVALLLGLFAGALLLFDFAPHRAFFGVIDSIVVDAVADPVHVQIIVYTVVLGAMIGVIQRSGGTLGIVDVLSRHARSARSTQLATGTLSTAVFFDDWSSCLIVGSTMRPLSDRMRVSREKLAFIVHSLAISFASLVPFSTWVGTHVGLVQGALASIEPPLGVDPFTTLLRALPACFYPVLAIALVFATAAFARERGSMLAAERRARTTGKVVRDGASPLGGASVAVDVRPDRPRRAVNALLPIAALVATTLAGLWITGSRAGADTSGGFVDSVRAVLERADSNYALLWASTLGVLVAVVLALAQRLLTLGESVDAACDGARSMTVGMLILVLSWGMSNVSAELHAKDWLAHVLLGKVSPAWFPCLVFGAGMAISFSIGTAWGTMGILTPLTVPTAALLARGAGYDAAEVGSIVTTTVAATFGGSLFGNHASPLADTAVLASISTSSDLFDHLRTQLPYTLLAASIAVTCGYAPVALGLPPIVALILCVVAVALVVRFAFARVDAPAR